MPEEKLSAHDPTAVLIKKIRANFETFAARALWIKVKAGQHKRLLFNSAQRYLDSKINEQIAQTGKARILVLKGRQQGISTYTEGRFYYKVTGGFGRKAFILTHEDKATKNLFSMASRYHEKMDIALKPSTKRDSSTELYFDKLDSGYGVGTARSKGTGRSDMIQYFHGSEVAFWPNQDEHLAGILQALPNAPGTEAILETTANGKEMFYDLWQEAQKGKNQWWPIFIPWFWQEEYRIDKYPPDFELTQEEREIKELYGLDLAQMAWRRDKINTDFRGKEWIFKQEYPSHPEEAFQGSKGNSLIEDRWVIAARKGAKQIPFGAKIIGLDVARQGKDRSAAIFRQGRHVHWSRTYDNPDLMATAGWAARIYDEIKPDAMFIDETGGYGAGVIDRMRERGYNVIGIQFGGAAIESHRFKNKRAEMWGLMCDWLREGGVSIPDEDDLHSDLTGPEEKRDSSDRLQLESKEDMQKRGVPSPDKGDALALTFAQPVTENVTKNVEEVINRPAANWRT